MADCQFVIHFYNMSVLFVKDVIIAWLLIQQALDFKVFYLQDELY